MPEGQAEWGKARELAAEKIGLSGTSAERGLLVLEEIEKRHESKESSEALDKLTNSSINGAFKYAYALGWLDSAVKGKPKTRKATKTKTDQNHKSEEPESAVGGGNLANDSAGWLTDELIGSLMPAGELDEETAMVVAAVKALRPHIYAFTGTGLKKGKSGALQHLLKVMSAIADKYNALAEVQA